MKDKTVASVFQSVVAKLEKCRIGDLTNGGKRTKLFQLSSRTTPFQAVKTSSNCLPFFANVFIRFVLKRLRRLAERVVGTSTVFVEGERM